MRGRTYINKNGELMFCDEHGFALYVIGCGKGGWELRLLKQNRYGI